MSTCCLPGSTFRGTLGIDTVLSKTGPRSASSMRAGHFVSFVHLQLLTHRRPSVWKEWYYLQPGQGAWVKKVFAQLISDHCEPKEIYRPRLSYLTSWLLIFPNFPDFLIALILQLGRLRHRGQSIQLCPFFAFQTGSPSLQQSSPTLLR